jgi:iron complex outermembrane receptor protein
MKTSKNFKSCGGRGYQMSSTAMGAIGAALALSAGSVLGAPTAALAQTASSTPAKGLEEIVVTARKRDESLLQVPVAISAYSASTLQSENLTSLSDIAAYTPGLTLNDAASNHVDRANQQIIIRGMYDQVSPAVSVFIDGAPVASGFVAGVQDAASVEILKGPQSAYFGRETFAGAINIVTKDPTNKLSGFFDGLVGSDKWLDVTGSVSGPLIADKLSGSLTVRDYYKTGQYPNSVQPGQELGTQSTRSISGSLKATPFENFTAKIYGAYWEDRDGPPAEYKFSSTSYNCNAGGAPAGTLNYVCGALPVIKNNTSLGYVTNLDSLFRTQVFGNSGNKLIPLFSDMITNTGFARDAGHGHIELTYAPPSWAFSITSLTSVNTNQQEDIANLDDKDVRGIINPYHFFIPGTESYYSWTSRVQSIESDVAQELRITSNQSQRFRWLVGGNFAATRSQTYIDGLFPFGTATFGGGGPQFTQTEAVFFSGAYDIIPKLTLSLEGRYQSDKISVYNRASNVPNALVASTTVNSFLPRVTLQYGFAPTAIVYASYAEGVNPPAFNTGLVGIDARIVQEFQSIYGAGVAVQPEYSKDYELGVKGTFFDRKLQLAADVYYINWTNQILSEFASVPGVAGVLGGLPYSTTVQVNAGRTHLDGVEVDGAFTPISKVVFNFSGAYNHTQLDSYPGYVCPASACNNTNTPTNINGHHLTNAPELSGTFALTFTDKLFNDVDYFIRAEDIYKGSSYVDLTNLTEIGASNKVNLHLGVTWNNTRAEFFVQNLLNDRQYTGIQGDVDIDAQPNALGVYPLADIFGMPLLREFGFKLHQKF